MVSDVPVDDEAPVVTSGIFRSAGAQSFGGAHRGRVCVRVFIGCECACVLWASSLYCVILKKKLLLQHLYADLDMESAHHLDLTSGGSFAHLNPTEAGKSLTRLWIELNPPSRALTQIQLGGVLL